MNPLDIKAVTKTENYPTYDIRFSLKPALYFAFRDVRYHIPIEDSIFPEHSVPFYELIIAAKQTYQCYLEGKSIKVAPKDILLIKPWQKHSDILQQQNGFYAVHFQIYSQYGKPVPFFVPGISLKQQIIRHDKSGHVQHLLEVLFKENRYSGHKDFLIQKNLFQAFFWALTDLCPSALLTEELSGNCNNGILIHKFTSIFENHIHSDLSLDVLCRQTRLSGSTLRRKSLELFGLPPMQAFIRYKILWIKKYFHTAGDVTVSETAALFGFKTPYHFSRVFKKNTGLSPSDCIKKQNFE